MNRLRIAVAATAIALSGAAWAQTPPAASPPPPPDFSKVEIKTTDLGDHVYMLEGQGGNITVAVAKDGIIMVDGEYAPLHDKIRAAIATVSNQPIKYLVNTHFHGDHTGGNEAFAKEGATVAQDNIRVRLAAGTVNGLTGTKTAPTAAGGIPTDNYVGGTKKVDVGGRTAILTHANNAHTDGDTWVYFPDANVLATGDIFTNGRYPNIDFANGGGVNGVINAVDAFLKASNDNTRIVPGHGPLATKAQLAEYRNVIATARDRIRKLYDEGKSEQEVLAAKPLAELDGKWAANEQAANNFVRVVYNSFKRS
jgi:cyclase